MRCILIAIAIASSACESTPQTTGNDNPTADKTASAAKADASAAPSATAEAKPADPHAPPPEPVLSDADKATMAKAAEAAMTMCTIERDKVQPSDMKSFDSLVARIDRYYDGVAFKGVAADYPQPTIVAARVNDTTFELRVAMDDSDMCTAPAWKPTPKKSPVLRITVSDTKVGETSGFYFPDPKAKPKNQISYSYVNFRTEKTGSNENGGLAAHQGYVKVTKLEMGKEVEGEMHLCFDTVGGLSGHQTPTQFVIGKFKASFCAK